MIIYKEIGETPLEALERFRASKVSSATNDTERATFRDVPMTYAGRLDPIAEGELLILIGDECKKKDQYLGLDKEYEVEIVFGLETDTYDALGLVSGGNGRSEIGDSFSDFLMMTSLPMTFMQTYPPYSSRTIGGVQMHTLARAGELPDEIEMPHKEVTIYSQEILNETEIGASKLYERIITNIDKVKGDFRQEEIKGRWKEVLGGGGTSVFPLIKLSVKCSSGTYMRSLAHEAGKRAGTGAFAFSIKRTKMLL